MATSGIVRIRGLGGRLGLLLLAASLASCATLGGSTPPALYDLSAPTSFNGLTRSGARTAAQLLVPVPTAIDALASERIVVREAGGRIAFYPAVAWTDQLPPLIQAKLVQAFENSGRAKAVGKPGESLAIDYQVIVDVRAFELDTSSGTSAHVELGVKLLDDRSGKVRATKVFDARVPVGSDGAADVVGALDRAAGDVFSQIVVWTAGTI